MASVIMQTAAYQNAKNQHFWPSESSNFPGKRLPRPPNIHVLHTKKQFYPNKMQKKLTKLNVSLEKKKQQKLHLGNVSCTIDKALKVSPPVFLFKNRLLMQCHLIQTMSVHCLRPFKTSIWFMFCYSFFIFSQLFLFLSSSSFFFGGGSSQLIWETRRGHSKNF